MKQKTFVLALALGLIGTGVLYAQTGADVIFEISPGTATVGVPANAITAPPEKKISFPFDCHLIVSARTPQVKIEQQKNSAPGGGPRSGRADVLEVPAVLWYP